MARPAWLTLGCMRGVSFDVLLPSELSAAKKDPKSDSNFLMLKLETPISVSVRVSRE